MKDTITLAQANYKNVQMSEQTRSIIEQMQAVKTSSLPLEPSLQKNNYQVPKPPEKIVEVEQQGPTPQPISASQIATQIEKLISLKQQGILTEEEYQRAKARLLAG